jgi:hypothetical protein
MTDKLFDVIAVRFDTKTVRLIAEKKTERNADAIEMMALSRRGCEDEFFTTIQAGSYKNGDIWAGDAK